MFLKAVEGHCLVASLGFLSLLSHTTRTNLFRDGTTHYGLAFPHQSPIKEIQELS